MPDPDNIDFFNLFTIALLDRLYANFPTPIHIRTADLAMELVPGEKDDELWLKKVQSAGYATSFLAEEGFISYADSRPNVGQFANVRLTSKGLAVLNAIPSAIDKSEPNIGKIRKILAIGAGEAGKESIRQIVQSLLIAGLAAVPNVLSRGNG